MGRAAQHTRNLTDQQLALQNQLIAQSNQQGQQDRAQIMPTIQSLLNSQGYTPQQQSAITQQSLGAANTAFDALRERAANRMAATNNSAGYGDTLAQLGRQQAQTDASQAQQNQIAFANQQLKEQMAGLSALGQTYGIDTNLLGKAMGVPSELLGVRQRASSSSGSGLGSLFGVGAGIASLFGCARAMPAPPVGASAPAGANARRTWLARCRHCTIVCLASNRVECGSSLPLYSGEARLARSSEFADDRSTSRQAGTANSGGKPPHSLSLCSSLHLFRAITPTRAGYGYFLSGALASAGLAATAGLAAAGFGRQKSGAALTVASGGLLSSGTK
jgi:hypothetical protein